jgi:hypothetical protein
VEDRSISGVSAVTTTSVSKAAWGIRTVRVVVKPSRTMAASWTIVVKPASLKVREYVPTGRRGK